MKNSVLWLLCGCSAGYLIIYAAHMIASGNPFRDEGLPAMIAGACALFLILFIAANCRTASEPMHILLGKLMINAIGLNAQKGIDVYLCLQGNTGCICLTVEENKTVVYQNRSFFTNETNIRKMLRDVQTMRRYRKKKGAGNR